MTPFNLAFGIPIAILTMFAHAAEPAKSVGDWTVANAQRIRSADNTTCNWSFHVQGNSSIGGDITYMTPIDCKFAAHSAAGQDCGLVTTSQVDCEGSGVWQVNTGNSDMGFTVMVLVNGPLYSEAYFGFSDRDLDARNDIAAQTSSAYPIGANRRGLAEVRGRALSKPDAKPEMWLVKDVVRYVNQAKTRVTMSFNIQDGSATGSRCDVDLKSPKGVAASSWSWYNQKCEGSDYTVSWGYNATNDVGIMTLVSPARDRNAYFGWDHVNKDVLLETKGPSPVIPCQC